MNTPRAWNEERRLELLRGFGLLDSPPEREFDEIAELAATLCEAPIAVISLIDGGRQWFKSRIGIGMVETPREEAFCAHLLGHDDLLEVPDATLDPCFSGLPLVTGPESIRFYCGMPLTADNGEVLGALAVLDRVPRRLDARQRQSLRVLGRQVMAQIRLRNELRETHRREDALRESREALGFSEQRWQFALEGSDIGVWDWNIETGTVFRSQRWHRIVGLDPACDEPSAEFWTRRLHPDDRQMVLGRVQEHLEGQSEVYACEYRIRMESGRYKWILDRGRVLARTPDGKPRRLVGTMTDIDRRKRLEQVQAVEAAVFESISSGDALPEILCEVTSGVEGVLDGAIASVLRVEAFGGGFRLRDGAAPHLPMEYRKAVDGLCAGPAVGSCGTAVHRREPVVVSDVRTDPLWAQFRELPMGFGLIACWSVPVLDSQGLPVATFALYFREVREATPEELAVLSRMAHVVRIAFERDRAEKALRRSEDRFASLFRNSPAAIGISTVREGRILDVNQRCCELLGYQREELIGRTVDQVHLYPDETRRGEVVERLLEKGRLVGAETRLRGRDGRFRDVVVSLELLELAGDANPVMVAQIADITDRKAAEQRLIQSQALMRMASRVSRLGAWQIDFPSLEVTWSEEVREIHGVPPDYQATAEGSVAFYLPECRPLIRNAVRECARLGKPFDLELRIRSLSGQEVWVRSIGEAVRDDAGCIHRVQGTCQDISQTKRNEERIAEQAALIDESRDAIIVRGLDDRILFWSKGAERLYGWTALEVADRSLPDLLKTHPGRFQLADRAVRGSGAWNGELAVSSRNGTALTLDSRWTLLRDGEGRPKSILAIDTDVTERKKLEQQFLRAQRMESIGTLAGGIAHDLNNVLAPILMSIELLRLENSATERNEVLDTIESSARRGADMVNQVLSFARGVEGRRVTLQVRHLIRDVAKIASETFPRNIEIRTHTPGDLEPVLGDPTQIHQVLLNLCVNARDAMPQGGVLTLSARNLVADMQYAGLIPEAQAGRYILIEVEDTGTGMDPETIENIFDPFFTTKEPGKGTGLGLSTSLAIVRSHGGFFRVHSEPGRGSCFRVHLPSTVGADETPKAPEPVLPRGNGEWILVVDDEPAVRQVARQTLEAFGYRVATASDGAEAVAIHSARPGQFAVVLTDMMMPVMDGTAAIEAILRLDPSARIIAASGLSLDGRIAAEVGSRIRRFLPKPYSAETLLAAVHGLLSGTPPAVPPSPSTP
jgi:PAS domain S-box-containing protein